MDKLYYKEYFDFERQHWWFCARKEIIRSLVIKCKTGHVQEKLRILNIGVATGSTTTMLEEFGEVTSVEYDKECCEFLEERLGIKAVNASITDLPFNDNEYDIVCAFDVIEHVEDDLKALTEMNRVAKHDALIMITVPAFMFLWSQHDDVNHHFRRYTMKGLMAVASKAKLVIEFKSYFNFFLFFPITFYRLMIGRIFKSKKGAGSDFEINNGSKWLNNMLFKIFLMEKYILKFTPLPVGVSILLLVRKENIKK